MDGGHSDTQNGRVESVRLKQLSVFRYLRQPRSATTLKKWRGEESPSVLRRRGCQTPNPTPHTPHPTPHTPHPTPQTPNPAPTKNFLPQTLSKKFLSTS
ncbi:MAG: hypothetical protein EWV40_17595 [Microcystis flos-aquae Mf_WU_F_19750830_S460]|uniref:Uncharacterized protein n=1 Tax=Microcystis flos-aquae Mf_WU_F_19750830_S460 TaxID=2486237 RepID=A0A552LDJ9_9CHRO|nr:MAG: hypothetical protein EWV40_17595 [Microcystis flos-aquae Mf_WU_F_19750830_S460]